MKSFLPFLFLGTFLFSIQLSFAQNHRLVGYLPYYQFNRADEIDFEKLTHLCLAFANPDADGNLSIGGRDIDPIVEIAHEAGITAVIQPGGSIKDQLSIDFCNENNISMVFTGNRHFKH